MAIDFQQSISDPISQDVGNKVLQDRTVVKTIKLGLFTTNKNAVWAANQQLRKESYPLAMVNIPVNRNLFRLQVGDVFKWSYSKYGISNMVLRVLHIEEDSLDTENITIHCIEDFFAAVSAISQDDYTDPDDNQIAPPDYTVNPLESIRVVEAPYVLSPNSTQLIPMAGKNSDYLTGFNVYMSIDDGDSYTFLSNSLNLAAHGTLEVAYPITGTLDDGEDGILVNFTEGQERIESAGMGAVLAGESNLVYINDELLSFTTITPISGVQYRLTGIIRNRYGTEKEHHSGLADVYFVSKSAGMISHSEIIYGADRKFKLVPYNGKQTGDIAEATAIDLTIAAESSTPYRPTNFDCNGVSYASRYTSGGNCVLTWTPRKRGEGAGIGLPGVVLPETDREGYFEIEVWVSSVLVRTQSAINSTTWTYTNAMNVADNGTPADEITFKISNYLESGGITYESDQTTVITKKSF